jgi:hypothetical protein
MSTGRDREMRRERDLRDRERVKQGERCRERGSKRSGDRERSRGEERPGEPSTQVARFSGGSTPVGLEPDFRWV